MRVRVQFLFLAAFVILLLLAILFPRPAASDVPVVASRIPASEFGAIRSAEPLASGQASISADPQLRTQNDSGPISEAAQSRLATWASDDAIVYPLTPAPSPSASKRVPTPTPVRITETPARESSAGSAVSTAGRSVPAATSTPLRGKFGVVVGTASWFRSPRGVSAAGPALRTALGRGWRGRRVTVTGPAGSAVVVLGDWMRADRLIDLDDDVFPAVCGPLSRGICEAKVTW